MKVLTGPAKLRWRELSEPVRATLVRKLEGLYGARLDEEAFNQLGLDKQQALLLLAGRLSKLRLWESVRRVENVYGEGGVGMNFKAWPDLWSALKCRKDFTTLFAGHKDNSGGFMERRRVRASLHFLYRDTDHERLWAVHFDLYNPWASPRAAWLHLSEEKIKGLAPDWRVVSAVLTSEGKMIF